MLATFRSIEFGSADFRKECSLRSEVLYTPLGLDMTGWDLSPEKEHFHFGLFDPQENIIACVIATPLSAERAKIRQMAVAEAYRGKGQGRMLLTAAENGLAQKGFSQVVLHALMTAAGFYDKLGYTRTGEVFLEVGWPHIKMEKTLVKPSTS